MPLLRHSVFWFLYAISAYWQAWWAPTWTSHNKTFQTHKILLQFLKRRLISQFSSMYFFPIVIIINERVAREILSCLSDGVGDAKTAILSFTDGSDWITIFQWSWLTPKETLLTELKGELEIYLTFTLIINKHIWLHFFSFITIQPPSSLFFLGTHKTSKAFLTSSGLFLIMALNL